MSPTHIAINAHLLAGDASYRSAGIHGHIYNILACLPDADPGLEYTVFVGRGDPPAHPALHVRRSRWPTQHALVRILWEQIAAPLALARRRPALLHGMAYALPLLWRGPAIVTIHDLSFLRYPAWHSAARRAYLAPITRLSAHRAGYIIAVSQSGKDEIQGLLGIPAEKITVIYNGVAEAFHPSPPEALRAFRARHHPPERYIFYLGTLEPRKNLETLLRAYARLPQRGTVKLVLAGGRGWMYDSALALIEALNLTDNVILPGYLASDLLPMWYNAADVFAYPSLYEGFGMPLLEAMACGTPVIASDASALPEVVGDAGVLVPPTDVEAWTEALVGLLESPSQRAELAAQGLARARLFTWEQSARQTAAAYRRLSGQD
jgi:glycosyltransferase involved in cell wall biosynthesis